MILQPLTKQDFEFKRDVRVDVNNKGFTPDEMQKLGEGSPAAFEARKGRKGGFVDLFWKQGRKPALQDVKSDFGYQTLPLLTDLIAVAEAQGTPLEGTIKARMAHNNFYIMRCGVYIEPKNGEKFEALKFEVRYKAPKVATHGMLPGAQMKKLLEVGGTANVGVDGKAEFGIPPVKLANAAIDASAKAELNAKFIVSFEYELKAPVIDVYGLGNPFCRWLMHKSDNLRNDVVFCPIIMTPKNVTELDCEFSAFFKISHSDWTQGEFFEKPATTIRVA
jgi:hypothetical protein